MRKQCWTPAESSGEGLPVLLWIHGGAYLGGYSYEQEFDGEAMCKKGCILVSIEYRCNAFGFFGHPENITVFGQSAGAMSTRTLLASPRCTGLIRHAIIQSGGGINDWSEYRTMEEQEQFGVRLLEQADMTFEEVSDAMVDYWCNFAKSGDPNGPGLPKWSAYSCERPETMCFSDTGFGMKNLNLELYAEEFKKYFQQWGMVKLPGTR